MGPRTATTKARAWGLGGRFAGDSKADPTWVSSGGATLLGKRCSRVKGQNSSES